MNGPLFIIKQYLKSFIQNKYLPVVYDHYAKKSEIKEGYVLFGDAHSNVMCDNFRPVAHILKEKGYTIKTMCRDIDRLTPVRRLSFMRSFMKEYASAETVCLTSYFLPVSSCDKRPETRVFQLWHSGGLLKKMGLDTYEDIPRCYKGNVTKNYDVVTVSAPVCKKVWEKALGLEPGTAVATGLSGTDRYFSSAWKKEMKKRFFSLHPEAEGKKLLLYSPSFSGNAARPQCRGLSSFVKKIYGNLGDEWYTIISLHPLIRKNYPEYEEEMSTSELLAVADLLVTDYSSVLFEYILMDKPFIMYCPDIDEYRRKRGFYSDPESFPGSFVRTASELRNIVLSNRYRYSAEELRQFRRMYMGSCDGHSSERIVRLIMNKNIEGGNL